MQLEDKKLQKVMLSLLINSDSEEAFYEIQTYNDSDSPKEEITICLNNCNVITKYQSQEELLFEIITKKLRI